MKKAQIPLLILTVVFELAVAGSAAAQAPPLQRLFFGANMGIQPSARTFEVKANPIVYGEVAPVTSVEGVDGTAMVDLQGGYRIRPNLSIALGVTTTMSTNSEARVVALIPDPLLYDRHITRESGVTGLKHTERSAHLSVMWTTPVAGKLDATVLGGPSYIKVFQDLVQNVDVPVGTQNSVPLPEQATATKLGFHVGGDLIYGLTPAVGLGVMARFVGATADLPSVPDVKVGGIQYGAGIRLRF